MTSAGPTARPVIMLGRSLADFSPAEYRAYIIGLEQRPKNASPIAGVKIVFGAKTTQVRIAMPGRQLTMPEIQKLAAFYEKPESELITLLRSRDRIKGENNKRTKGAKNGKRSRAGGNSAGTSQKRNAISEPQA